MTEREAEEYMREQVIDSSNAARFHRRPHF